MMDREFILRCFIGWCGTISDCDIADVEWPDDTVTTCRFTIAASSRHEYIAMLYRLYGLGGPVQISIVVSRCRVTYTYGDSCALSTAVDIVESVISLFCQYMTEQALLAGQFFPSTKS